MPVVVVGITTHQGERESRSQGEGAQVLTIDNDGEVREMRNAATVLAIIHYEHWRAGCPEIGHVRFGGGPSEKDQLSWHLVGGLPYITSGSAGGRAEKDQPQLAPRRSADPTGWLMLHHRLARDYETLTTSSEAMIHLAMIDNVSKRITDEATQTWRGTY